MDTVLVAIIGNHSKFDCLQAQEFISIDNGPTVRVVLDRTDMYKLTTVRIGDIVVSSHDITITNSNSSEKYAADLYGRDDYHYVRYSKLDQATLINKIALWNTNKFRKSVAYDQSIPCINALKKVVIKPQNGARGIGQIVLDTTKVNLQRFLEALSANAGRAIAMYRKHITYTSINERREDEGIEMLRHFVITEYIPDIVEEYRCITGSDGDIAYIQKRELREAAPGYTQAIGSNSGNKILTIGDLEKKLGANDLSILKAAFVKEIGPLQSFDLWIDKNGQWGIFEFSNEYGTEGIPPEIYRDFTMKYLVDLIAKFKGIPPIEKIHHGVNGFIYANSASLAPPVETIPVEYKKDTRCVMTPEKYRQMREQEKAKSSKKAELKEVSVDICDVAES